MSLITPEWQVVLTDHINRKYKTSLLPSALKFKHNRFYTPIKGCRIIDVLPADGTLIGRGTLFIKPRDPSKYFLNTPVTIYPEDDITGSQLVDLLGTKYGIVFDKAVDIESAFLTSSIKLGAQQTITIPFKDDSFVWDGSLDIVIADSGLNLPTAIRNRDLDALIIPDITDDSTQSLQLLTTPIIISDKTLVRKFSASGPILIEGNILDRLMVEIQSQLIVDNSDLGGLRDLFTNVEFIGVDTGDTDYDRYVTSMDSLANDKFSGKPRFRFKSVVIEDDIQSVVGEIVVKDLPDPSTLKLSSFMIATGDYSGSNMANLLTAQANKYPERAEGINEVIRAMYSGDGGVFESMDRSSAYAQLSTGKATVYLQTREGSGWTGRLSITFPMPTFAIEDESQKDLETEDGSDVINLEQKFIVVYTNDGTLTDGDIGTPVSNATLAESSLLALMAYNNDADGTMPKLKSTLVSAPIADGNAYTEAGWPNVEIHAKAAPQV